MKKVMRGVKQSSRKIVRTHIEALEQRQLLSAALSASSKLLVFNAVQNSSASQTETITLTNSGNSVLTLGASAFSVVNDPTSSTQDSARFTLVNAASAPATLSPGQSFGLQLIYASKAIGINSAFLDVTTNDPINPTDAVALRGIGTAGLGGTNQPSLATILRAYEIPTIVGEGFDDANAATDTTYPEPPDASSQEVPLQRLVKAGSGPVTITTLASFTAAGTKPYTLGTYTPGNPTSRSELFYTPTSEYQSTYVQPQGATSFDPGTNQFGFYFVSNVQVQGRIGYTEDGLNTWDTTDPRKFRFFPMENPDGSVVPNTYIMTTTEWNAPVGYDFTNIVAVVSNIKAAPGAPNGPAITLQPVNAVPGSNRMVFNTITTQNTTVGDTFHNTGVLQVSNSGNQPLVISSYTLSSGWALVSPPTFPVTIAKGASLNLTLKFVQSSVPSHPYNETNDVYEPNAGAAISGSLTLNSNDPNHPAMTQALAGYYQTQSENSEEPSLQTILNLVVGLGTTINSTPIDHLTEGSTPTYYGEEVVSAYWSVADLSQKVSVQQLSSWHTQGNSVPVAWYPQGTTSAQTLFTTGSDYGQTFFPNLNGTTTPASASFTPSSTAFGFKVDTGGNAEWSDDSLNYYKGGGGHQVRFFPVRDGSGNLVPNTYIMTMDYGVVPNYDTQDNTYIISNIRPAALPAVPTDLFAVAAASGGVSLEWAPVQDTTLSGYKVYRSTSATGTYSLLTSAPISQTSYVDVSAPVGLTEYYRVTAVDATAGAESLAMTTSATAATASTTAPPAAPANLAATALPNAISLSWSAVSDPTLKGYNIYRSTSATGTFTLENSSPIAQTTYTDSLAPAGVTEYYHVTAVDAVSGLESTAATVSDTALAVTTLTSVDVGASLPGSTTVVTPGTDFNVTAGGPGIAANADGFRYVYQTQTGNFDVKVQVTALSVAGNYSTAGILARSTLDTTSPDVYMSASPTNYRFKYRSTVGGVNNIVVGNATSFPSNVWLRLSRVGNLFTGYSSTDGVNWTMLSSITLALPTELNLGLGVASNNTTQTTTAQLRDYSNTTTTKPVAPAAPTNLTATGVQGAVNLAWTAVQDTTLKGYNVYSSSSATGSFTLLTSTPITATNFSDTTAIAGAATFYRVTAVDSASGLESVAATASGTALAAPTGLQSIDIGASLPGSTTVVTPGTDFNVTAGGPGIAANADGFRYVYQSQTGDFDVKVQVISLTVAGNYSTAGILARSALTTTSPDVYMSASPTNYRFKERSSDGGVNNIVIGNSTSYPNNVWVRLSRVGNLFTGYSSTDGVNWTMVSSITLALPTTLNLGLGVASNNTTQTTTAQLRDYSNTVTSKPVAPAAPTNLTATGVQGAVKLAWTAVQDATLKGYNVYSSSSATGTFSLLNPTPITATSFSDASAPVGTAEFYKVTAVDASSGLESAAATASGTALAVPVTLTSIDIGTTQTGSTTSTSNGYTVVAGGPGVTDVSDGFRYLYTTQTGNFDVKVQVSSITVAGNFATAGIMARSTLDADSANVYMSATPANYRFKDRPTAGATTAITASGTPVYPNVWVRLQRVGNVFNGYTSTDGVTWTLMSSVTLALPTTLDLGLAVASNNSTQTTTAVLQDYSNT